MSLLKAITLTGAVTLALTANAYAGGSHEHGDAPMQPNSANTAIGHHGENMGHGSEKMSHHGQNTGRPGKVDDVTQTIDIAMFDNYFKPEALSISKDETIRFKVTNSGQMVHEFNIGTAIMHKAHQKEMMMMVQNGIIQGGKLNRDMMTMDMGNGQKMEHNDPNSILLAPGESGEIIWTFSEQAKLEFACNVPGHYESGMSGKVNIK
tara:strand:- start:5923 stop:6543 length:621 start_codon:yes stop_codon:yes gene_type:complete